MKAYEFGKQNTETILLLHGGGLSWWNFRGIARLLEERYHVVLPVLDGHAGSEDAFESIEANAGRVAAYIDESCGGHVLAVGGLSLGAQVAAALLAERPEICEYAVIESASLYPSRLTHALIEPSFSSSYFLIRYRWFSRLQFRALHIQDALYEEYYRDTCRITKRDMIEFMKASTAFRMPEGIRRTQAKLLVIVGEKEQRSMKRSAQLLRDAVPGARLYTAKGLYHGELSLNAPEQYVGLLAELLS